MISSPKGSEVLPWGGDTYKGPLKGVLFGGSLKGSSMGNAYPNHHNSYYRNPSLYSYSYVGQTLNPGSAQFHKAGCFFDMRSCILRRCHQPAPNSRPTTSINYSLRGPCTHIVCTLQYLYRDFVRPQYILHEYRSVQGHLWLKRILCWITASQDRTVDSDRHTQTSHSPLNSGA